MKTVFRNSSEVIHIFAQQNQSEGRCPNVYFQDNICYSYGRHYELGRYFKNSKGETAIMINDSGYSNTTSKHIAEMKQATRHQKQFFTTQCEGYKVLSHLKNYLLPKLEVAKKPENYINEANFLFSKYTEYLNFTGNKPTEHKEIVKVMKSFNPENLAEIMAKAKNRIEKAKQAKELHKKQVETIGKKLFEKWLEFWKNKEEKSPNYFEFMELQSPKNCKLANEYKDNLTESYLRINGNEIETTQGAIVDILEAKILYRMITQRQDIKGFQIGNYTVVSINGVLKVGCHEINIESVHEIGKQLLKM